MKARHKAVAYACSALVLALGALALLALYGVLVYVVVNHGHELEALVEQTTCTVLTASNEVYSCCLTGLCGCQDNYVCTTEVAYEVANTAYQETACSFSPTCCEVKTEMCEENNCTQATDSAHGVDTCYQVLAIDEEDCVQQEGAQVACWYNKQQPQIVALAFDPAFTGASVGLSVVLLLFVGVWLPLAMLYAAVRLRRRARAELQLSREHKRLVQTLRAQPT